MAEDFSFELKETIGPISAPTSKGWVMELSLVSWNGKEPKYDIRSWDPEHKKMSKGVSLTREQILTLRDLINERVDTKE